MAKILLLEADQPLANNLRRYLRNSGHKVVWSATPQAAIEATDQTHPDVIVMDILLGGHSGVEFLYELRSYPEWQKLPVIILSSLPAHDVLQADLSLEQLNIAKYFYKPDTALVQVAAAVDNAVQPVRL